MNTESNKPKLLCDKITFSDGTEIELSDDEIIVFTGPNNVGKSKALREIEQFMGESKPNTKVIKDVSIKKEGNILDDDFIKDKFTIEPTGQYKFGFSIYANLESIKSSWNGGLFNGMQNLLVNRISTENRLNDSNPVSRTANIEGHPIYKLFNSVELEKKISSYFYKAFRQDLLINRNDFSMLPLLVGMSPRKTEYTIAEADTYYAIVDKMPRLSEQGDGMRSFASILLDTFASYYSITMIDEPEAFLHPPQARVLGQMLAENHPEGRQLFLATHSQDFLQGLLDVDKNIKVVRITRDDDVNNVSILENEDIKRLWSNPIFRYSNILSGLFHDKVIICESDYDCLFYQAMIDACFEKKEEVPPDILYIHCGGKSRMKEVVNALKAVNVPVVAICDFDIIDAKHEFKPLVEAFGLDWDNEIAEDMKVVFDYLNSKPEHKDMIKKVGKSALAGEAPKAYDSVEQKCKKVGLFVVPVGEMEDFDKTISAQKREWVYKVLETYDLKTEAKLDGARQFVNEIIDF